MRFTNALQKILWTKQRCKHTGLEFACFSDASFDADIGRTHLCAAIFLNTTACVSQACPDLELKILDAHNCMSGYVLRSLVLGGGNPAENVLDAEAQAAHLVWQQISRIVAGIK